MISKYYNSSTWLDYLVNADFRYSSVGDPLLFGFMLLPNDPTVANSVISCPTISANKLVSLKSTGNLTLTLIRNYLGLPYHQWAHLTIKYATLDLWQG